MEVINNKMVQMEDQKIQHGINGVPLREKRKMKKFEHI